MKQKLISLLTLLLCVCSGAWAYEGASGDVTFFKVNGKGKANKLADGCYAYRGSSDYVYNWSDGKGIKTQDNTGGIIVFYLSGTSNVTVDIKHTESNNAHNVTASFYALTENDYRAFYGITSETAVSFSLPGEATYTKTIAVGATASTFSGTQQLNAGYYAVVCNGDKGNTYHNAMHFETAEAPSAISFDPVSGTEQESGVEINLASTGATTLLYQWSSAAVDGDGDWSSATTYDDESKPVVPIYGSTTNVLSVKASNTYGDTYGSATYTIVAAKKDLTLAYSGNVTLKANETLSPAVLSASDDNGAVDVEDLIGNIEFESSDATVATVTSAGVVSKTGKVGSATITATFSGNGTYRPTNASYTITVQSVPIKYQEVNLTFGHTWDFTSAAIEEDDLIADTENWGLVSGTARRYTNSKELSEARMVANYEELVWTEGLYFSGKKGTFRLNMNSTPCNLQLNGSNIDIIIKGLKAGQRIIVEAKSASTDTDRYIIAQSNINVVSGFEDPNSADWTTSVGSVKEDGDIVLRSSAGLNIKSITLEPATATVTVGAKGYATYVNSDYTLDFTGKSIKAYVASSNVAAKTITLTQVNKLGKNTPVLLYSETNSDSQTIPAIADGEAETILENYFQKGDGSTAYTWAEDNRIYVLNTAGTPGFYKANNSKVATNKAYLLVPNNYTLARFAGLGFEDDGEATGIKSVETTTDGTVFNLRGQRVAQPQKGLYILNGKKVVLK